MTDYVSDRFGNLYRIATDLGIYKEQLQVAICGEQIQKFVKY